MLQFVGLVMYSLLVLASATVLLALVTGSWSWSSASSQSPRIIPENVWTTQKVDAMRQFVCFDEDVVAIIQREQWLQAHKEIFGNSSVPTNDKDMGFYREGFGALAVDLQANSNNYTSLVYYRIYKAGNDNIRSLLYEYAFNKSNQMDLFYSSGCPAEVCVHPNVTRIGAVKSYRMFYPENRFVFTFVRHPIARFISAMNEIESRASLDAEKVRLLALQSKYGTPERVMEFIQMILSYGGSGIMYRMYEALELNHLAPMVGTLQIARSTEQSPLRIYKLEDFGNEWRRISRHADLPELRDVFFERKRTQNWLVHASAADSLGVSRAATAFLSIAGRDIFSRSGEGNRYVPPLLPCQLHQSFTFSRSFSLSLSPILSMLANNPLILLSAPCTRLSDSSGPSRRTEGTQPLPRMLAMG